MKIGLYKHGWWKAACEAASHEVVELPVAQPDAGNTYAADVPARSASGVQAHRILTQQHVDLMLDNSGTGLGFVRDQAKPNRARPVHETVGAVWCSHFIDPLVTAFQGIGWSEVWQCLKSRTWIKAMWDRAGAVELRRFGVPSVIHLPVAAPNRRYVVEPLDTSQIDSVVSFVGGRSTNYFAPDVNVATHNLLAGALAHAARSDRPQVGFYEAYHDVYGLGLPLQDDDSLDVQVDKTVAYYNAKRFYNAYACIRNRDRFVISLRRVLGEQFRLIGRGWERAYGVKAEPPFESTDAYFDHFRRVAINVNLINGDAETGLNMQHFEITAAGGFMMCYDQPELAEQFEIGKECVVFQNERDLFQKTQYFLAHPDERAEIAHAGQRRTLSEHLYSHRLKTLLDGIKIDPLPVNYSTTTPWQDIKSIVSNPEVVLDCGANTGQTALRMRNAFPDTKIYCFEPVTSVFEKLQEACATIGAVAVKKAVADRDGRARIHLTAYAQSNSLLGFQQGSPCEKWHREVGLEEVEVCTLDRWCEECNIDCRQVGLLKLDVQGAELRALYGARRLLQAGVPVFLEVQFVPLYKDAPLFSNIDRYLSEFGYRRFGIYQSDQPHSWADALYVKDGAQRGQKNGRKRQRAEKLSGRNDTPVFLRG